MVALSSRDSGSSPVGKNKGGDEIDLEAAMKNTKLKDSELDDIFVGRRRSQS